MKKEKAFEMLKEFSKKLDQIPYDDIYSLLIDSIQRIPIPMAVLHKNTEVDRARLNIGTELYNNINDLGYIKEDDIIEKYLKNYGRANKPHQVMFYAAIRTSLIDKPRLTAITETSELFQDKNGHNLKGEKYTISRWLGNEKFYVAEIVFAKKAIENNSDIKKAFENQINFANQSGEKDIEFYKEFLIFISEEFARKITKNDDYKISVAYTNLILQHPEIEGIVFPSVQTGYQGANIVMPPSTIDKYFQPKTCTTHILYKTSENMLIANGEHYCNNISTEKLEWQLTEKHLLSSEDDIKRHFKL